MIVFGKPSNKDIVKKIENLDEKLDLIHKSIARLRIDLPKLIAVKIEYVKLLEKNCN
jgi:hypothetical protein